VPSAYRTIAAEPGAAAPADQCSARSSASVKEAALGAGFSKPAYFSRVFARRFGVPPSRWREALG